MSARVCGCVLGPPAGGVCHACGAVGAPLPHQQQAPIQWWPWLPMLTEDRVRQIIREEIDRMRPVVGRPTAPDAGDARAAAAVAAERAATELVRAYLQSALDRPGPVDEETWRMDVRNAVDQLGARTAGKGVV